MHVCIKILLSFIVQEMYIPTEFCKLTRSLDQVVYSAITIKHAVESENRT